MALSMVLLALVIIVCIAANKFSNKLGVPTLLIFIAIGMMCGVDGIFKITFDNYSISENVCSIALLFIIFYGGFGTNWQVAKPVAVKSLGLSTIGVLITALLTGLFCHLVLGFELLESLLIGSVISSTDAASVFSVLRSHKLNLKHGTASMLEIESGSNDPFAYMLTLILLQLISSNSLDGKNIIFLILSQVFFGCAIGLYCAFIGILILKKINFYSEGMETIFVLALAILSFALPQLVNGNGYLSVYICGIVLGNSQIKSKAPLVHFFDGITSLAQITIFFLLGLLSTPSQMLPILLPSLAIAVFLTLISRPLSVFAVLTPFKCKIKQQLLVAWSGLRGAASIVFAIMAITNHDFTHDIFHIVFCVSLFSVALQGTLLPTVARKLKMVDDKESVLKTFNDYTENSQINLIKIKITQELSWSGKAIKKLNLPKGTLIVLIRRGQENIIPNGNTVVEMGDIAILSAESYEDDTFCQLKELSANNNIGWIGKKITDIDFPEDTLVVMIKRKGKSIIPQGNTKIRNNDILVLCGIEK